MEFLNTAINWRPDVNLPWEVVAGDETPETLRCLWPFFRFSRVIGMCPLTRQGNEFVVARKLHPSWFFTWFAVLLLVIMWFNYTWKSFPVPQGGTTAVIIATNTLIYYSQILFTCFYMIWNVDKIPVFAKSCIKAEAICRNYMKPGTKHTTGLVRDTYVLFVFYTCALVVGSTLYYASIAKSYKLSNVWDFFHAYDGEFVFIEGNAYSGVFFLFAQFYCDMGWTFADILLSILALMLSRLFTRLNRVLAREQTPSLFVTEQMRADHQQICELVFTCNDIFSPLFLLTYIANVAYLFTRLYSGLGNDLKKGHILIQLETLYAFAFLIFTKILIPSYLGAQLHEKAHAGLDFIHKWSSTVKRPEYKYKLLVIGRFVSQMSTTEVGFSGCGYFTITKSFVVTLLSALITYEVIVLQFQAAALKESE